MATAALLVVLVNSAKTDEVMKPSRAEAEKLVGKRTALPGGSKQLSPNFVPKKASDGASSTSPKRENFLNPKQTLDRREKEAGLKCGGKVRRK